MLNHPRKTPQAGFALVEILLVAMLLLLFTSAAVMNLAPLWQGARLDEGVGQLESLLRFARAEAAQQGRRLQLQVQAPSASESDGITVSNQTAVQVRWEPEPLDQPGVFVESQATAALARSVTENVRIEHVRRLESSAEPTAFTSVGEPGTMPSYETPAATAFEPTVEWPPIMFYPDGSSDSAEILVGSAEATDSRRMVVKWNGLSGSAARQEMDAESPRTFGIGTAEAQPLEPASVARTTLGQSAP
jgi:Tfp pilus assembly protein FimT